MAMDVNEVISVPLPRWLVKRIEGKSDVPAVEGMNGILVRVLDEHDKAYPNQPKRVTLTVPMRQEPTHFKTSRGFQLPIGLQLISNYDGKHVTAKVTASGIEYRGKTYDVSPSAFAAKKDCGATDTAASTNGWKFWQYVDGDRTRFIDAFRYPADRN